MKWNKSRLFSKLELSPSIIEPVYADIAEIDSIKHCWPIASKQILANSKDKLSKSIIDQASIAAININHKDNNYINSDNVNTSDKNNSYNYATCLEYIFNNYANINLTEDFILNLHNKILYNDEINYRHSGRYRYTTNAIITKDNSYNFTGRSFEASAPYLIKTELLELINWYNWARADNTKHNLILISNFIFEFLAIHPFQKGTNRVSMLLTNLLLLKSDYLFIKNTNQSYEQLIEQNKVNYYIALNKTQSVYKTNNDSVGDWLIFFLDLLKQQSKQAINIINHNNIEDLLSSKQKALWQWTKDINTEFSRKDAIGALKYPSRTIEEIIKKLVKLNHLQQIGQGRATRYKILNNKLSA